MLGFGNAMSGITTVIVLNELSSKILPPNTFELFPGHTQGFNNGKCGNIGLPFKLNNSLFVLWVIRG
jgi:hypothetical protein